MNRVLLTAAVGNPKFADMAIGLARSLQVVGDTTDRAILTDIPGIDWGKYFKYVLPVADTIEKIFFSKLSLLDRTEVDQVLWVDADCLAFQPLGPIFDHCTGKGLAIPGYLVREGSYYGRIEEHCLRHGIDALPNVTAGLIYYERSREAGDLIRQINEYGDAYDTLGFQRRTPTLIPDEPCISLAMAKLGYGELIDETSNFIHSAAGLVGKLRLDVMRNQCEFLCHQESTRFFRPRIFHAWRYKDFLIYWKQLDRLKQLEAYAESHRSMYMPRGARWVRSIQRRLIQLKKWG